MDEFGRGRTIQFLTKRRYGDVARFGDRLAAALKMAREPVEVRDSIARALILRQATHYEQTISQIANYVVWIEEQSDEELVQLIQSFPRTGLDALLSPYPSDWE